MNPLRGYSVCDEMLVNDVYFGGVNLSNCFQRVILRTKHWGIYHID